jgi:hypothetical protein
MREPGSVITGPIKIAPYTTGFGRLFETLKGKDCMRFIANGPSIPDALLSARDAGEVLFFCGAGVSRHKAKLPNFIELARTVANQLGSAQDSPARRLLRMASGDR